MSFAVNDYLDEGAKGIIGKNVEVLNILKTLLYTAMNDLVHI